MATWLESQAETYLCPGETHPITRAVHLARLAAFYPACRECQHRNEAGVLPSQTLVQIENTIRRIERGTLFTESGVRGVYLNELTSQVAGQMAAAFAHILWQAVPLRIKSPINSQPDEIDTAEDSPDTSTRETGPHVVVGYDERPSALDLVTGVVKSLRRMGCRVTDVGLVTRACFWQAVEHLQGAGGIHVTGAGCDPAWNGLDFVLGGAIPLTRGYRLSEIEQTLHSNPARPHRNSAGLQTFHASHFYESELGQHFHALRPLRVVCGCANRLLASLLTKIFEPLPCRLISVGIPVRARDMKSATDPDVARIRQSVLEHEAHVGILIDADGQTCAVLDEQGQLVSGLDLTWLLGNVAVAVNPGGTILLERDPDRDCVAQSPLKLPGHRGKLLECSSELSSIAREMRAHGATFGGGKSGRFWFREPFPTCDGVLTLAKLLQALSLKDWELSRLIQPE